MQFPLLAGWVRSVRPALQLNFFPAQSCFLLLFCHRYWAIITILCLNLHLGSGSGSKELLLEWSEEAMLWWDFGAGPCPSQSAMKNAITSGQAAPGTSLTFHRRWTGMVNLWKEDTRGCNVSGTRDVEDIRTLRIMVLMIFAKQQEFAAER